MANRSYKIGRNFEYRIRNWLIRRGYYVIRSYGSHGAFDLVAVPPKSSRLRRTLLIQAKYSGKNKVQISPEEKRRLANEARRLQGFSCLVFNQDKKLKWKLIDPYYY